MFTKIFLFLESIDRRIIYLSILIVLAVPYLLKIKVPLKITPPVQGLYDTVENLAEHNQKSKHQKIALFCLDWDPSTQAENWPQTQAVMEHLLMRDIKVAMMSWNPIGAGMATEVGKAAVANLKKHTGIEKEYGKDWCNWGYKYYQDPVVLSMIKDLYAIIKEDIYGTSIRDVPMMADVEGLHDAAFLYETTGGAALWPWIAYVAPATKAELGYGCTAVMGPEAYPYLNSGQLCGMLEGFAGAAQYELLTNIPGRATEMDGPQNFAHLWIILSVLLGNIGYLVIRKRKA